MEEWRKGMLENKAQRYINNVTYLQTKKAKAVIPEEERKQQLSINQMLVTQYKMKLNWYGIND